jgi:hypothetical protein
MRAEAEGQQQQENSLPREHVAFRCHSSDLDEQQTASKAMAVSFALSCCC